MPAEVTFATYNIHGCVGTDKRFDLPRIAAVIAELRADVIALQEVGDVRGRGPAGDYAQELAERLGLSVVYQPTMLRQDRAYGNALLTRLPVEGSRSFDLTFRNREPRGCIRADLRMGEQLLHVFGLHLGLSRGEQKAQAARLLGAEIVRDAAVSWPLIVMGDFNFLFRGPIARTVRSNLYDAAILAGRRDPTYPVGFPFLRLDRIYVDGAWEVQQVVVHRSFLSSVASDHLPLYADLRLVAPHYELPHGAEPGTLLSA